MREVSDVVDLELVVAHREVPAAGVVVLELRDPSGAELPPWSPGAHVDVDLGPDYVRQYSLCGDHTRADVWRVGVLHEPAGRGGSTWAFENLHEGSAVRISGLRNNFALVPSPHYLFIAGGIGITPIVPMIRAAEAAGSAWTLLYGGRTRASMAFSTELREFGGDRVTIHPQDEHGLLDLDAVLGTPTPDTVIYCCGPEPLLNAVEQRCAAWPPGSLHLERFVPKAFDVPVRLESFEVAADTSGLTVSVPPDKSILQALEEAGVDVPSSCQEGTCGTCETVVLDGVPEHRDSLLTPEEQEANETMMICVSRARSDRLVLEI